MTARATHGAEGAIVRVSAGEAGYPASLTGLGDGAPDSLSLLGNAALLELPLIGLFCSARLPPSGALASYDLARALRDSGIAVVGGFQSPTERECLQFLLRGAQPVVVCAARGLGGMQLRAGYRQAQAERRLLVVSPFGDRVRRPTAALAGARNRLVSALARALVVVHATPGGRLARLVGERLRAGQQVYCLALRENEDLRLAGAIARDPARLVAEVMGAAERSG